VGVEHGRGNDPGRGRVHEELGDARLHGGALARQPLDLGIDQRGVPVLDIGDCLGRVEHFADLAEALHHSLGELGVLNEFLTIWPFRDAAEAAHPPACVVRIRSVLLPISPLPLQAPVVQTPLACCLANGCFARSSRLYSIATPLSSGITTMCLRQGRNFEVCTGRATAFGAMSLDASSIMT
jgi:hypothetical protein